MEIFYDLEQGSDLWLKARMGVITASNFSKILGKKDKSERKTYLYKKAAELSGGSYEEGYKNDFMERGNEIEDQARAMYELKQKVEVEQIGFIKQEDYLGCSPDGLVGDDGMVEIKCPLASTHVKRIVEAKLPPEYRAQIQGQMWVAQRQWCDFVSFHPDVTQNIFILRVERDADYIADLTIAATDFIEEVKAVVRKVNG